MTNQDPHLCDTLMAKVQDWAQFQDILNTRINLHWMDTKMKLAVDAFNTMATVPTADLTVKVAVRSSSQS
jgi:hypothetical protein